MAKIDAKYETLFIINPDLGEEDTAAVVERFRSLIEANGTLDKVDEWGKRRLAYPIQDYLEGHYVLITFTCKPDFPAELSRIYNITDAILRSLTTVIEE